MAENKIDVRANIIRLNNLLDVQLPEDATESGFGTINQALSLLAAHVQEATMITNSAIADQAYATKDRAKAKVVMDLKMADLLANNAEVKAGSNAESRAAVAKVMIAKQIGTFEKSEMDVQYLKALVQAGDNTLSALKHTKELASHMLNVTQKEMDLGMITGESIAG